MKPILLASLVVVVQVSPALGCGGAAPVAAPAAASPPATLAASTKAATEADPNYASCHNGYKPTSNDRDIVADLAAMTQGCAETTKMKKVGETMTGELNEKKPPANLPLNVVAGRCYRVYGMSQSSMQDFDIAMIDSSGALVSEDTTDDASPVLAEDGKVCFKVADAVVLRASAGAGVGKFAIEVWSN